MNIPRETVQMALDALKSTEFELLDVLDSINAEKIPHDGDDFHETLNKAYKAITALREALDAPEPELVPFATVNGCGSHHYTAENVAALVKYLRDCENGIEEPKWQDKDHRTFAGILWRVIQAACDDLPFTSMHQSLTNEEIYDMYAESPSCDADMIEFARAIENAIRNKT